MNFDASFDAWPGAETVPVAALVPEVVGDHFCIICPDCGWTLTSVYYPVGIGPHYCIIDGKQVQRFADGIGLVVGDAP